MIDPSKLDNIVMGDVKSWDYPDFADAYIESAEYEGRELTDEELDWVNNNCPNLVYQEALNSYI